MQSVFDEATVDSKFYSQMDEVPNMKQSWVLKAVVDKILIVLFSFNEFNVWHVKQIALAADPIFYWKRLYSFSLLVNPRSMWNSREDCTSQFLIDLVLI